MRGERWLLRVGEFLVGQAARHLPAAARDERYREWAAELPVILGDPEIKPTAARAARMLWFAADTLRGAALGPGPARRGGAHRGGAHRGAAGKNARQLGVLAAALTGMAVLLTGMAVLLAIQAFIVYQTIFGVSLAFYVAFYGAFLLTSLASLAGRLLRRRPGGAGRYWFSAGVVAAAAGGGAAHLAGHLGWGHPLLFTLISVCGYAVWAACISVAWAIVIRSVRRDLRLGIQERSDCEQLRGPARAVGMSGQLRGSSGHARWHSLADREMAGGDGAHVAAERPVTAIRAVSRC